MNPNVQLPMALPGDNPSSHIDRVHHDAIVRAVPPAPVEAHQCHQVITNFCFAFDFISPDTTPLNPATSSSNPSYVSRHHQSARPFPESCGIGLGSKRAICLQ